MTPISFTAIRTRSRPGTGGRSRSCGKVGLRGELIMVRPIAATPVLTREDARRFVEAAMNPNKTPDVKFYGRKLTAVMRQISDATKDKAETKPKEVIIFNGFYCCPRPDSG